LCDHIYSIDKNKFRNIHIILFKNAEELDEARHIDKADVYKGAFLPHAMKYVRKPLKLPKFPIREFTQAMAIVESLSIGPTT